MSKSPSTTSDLPLSQMSYRIRHTGSNVWQIHDDAIARRERGDDIILLSVGDPDFPTPKEITDHLVRQVHGGRTHYSPASGEPGLRQALATLETRIEGRRFTADQFVIFPGATSALHGVFSCILNEGDEVIIPEPMYIGYHGIFNSIGASIISVPLDADRNFELRLDLIEDAITEKTRAVLINTPGNPCGNILGGEILADLASLCRARGIWLVSDEVYSLFSYDEPHVSLLRAAQDLDNVIVIDSLSKSHAMSGWRIGWTVAPRDFSALLGEYCGDTFFGCSQFIQDAAEFALSFNAPHILSMREQFRQRRDYVVDRLAPFNQLNCARPRAGMFAMVDVSGCARDGDEFARWLLDEAGISVIPGSGFGSNTRNHVRFSLTQPLDVLKEAFDRMEKCLSMN
ncbi:MAG: pyridoxal phosphate-dependent aminotransferase [Pseudomonadales bacterium]|nr:pyridoxal phosphate-dependent aminotransferase [Pseudomonadales bacterium]